MANVDILIAVDVAGALSGRPCTDSLSGNLYMVDTNKDMGSYREGGPELVTKLNNGDHLVWQLVGIDPATTSDIKIKSFSGQAISGGNISSLYPNRSYNPVGRVWEGNFVANPESTKRIPYTMTLSLYGHDMSWDPYLQWTGK